MTEVTEMVMDDMTSEVTKNIIETLKIENEFLREENKKLHRDYEEVFCRLDNLAGKCKKYETQANIARIWTGYNELKEIHNDTLRDLAKLEKRKNQFKYLCVKNRKINDISYKTINSLVYKLEDIKKIAESRSILPSMKKILEICDQANECNNDWWKIKEDINEKLNKKIDFNDDDLFAEYLEAYYKEESK